MSSARLSLLFGLSLGVGLVSTSCGNGDAPGTGGVPERCVAPAGVPTTPQTIVEVVDLINALPAPVTLPCFLQALARPLKMHATISLISAQPSSGARSPRIFLFSDGLRMSIVPVGAGGQLLEMGEIRDEVRSIKAEVEFPITAPLAAQTPFDRIMYAPEITRCSFCHAGEALAGDITFAEAWSSQALRPTPINAVTLGSLAAETAACDAQAEPDRCAMLHGLFDQRPPPVEEAFPANLATIQ
jgi:hypothetical protein